MVEITSLDFSNKEALREQFMADPALARTVYDQVLKGELALPEEFSRVGFDQLVAEAIMFGGDQIGDQA